MYELCDRLLETIGRMREAVKALQPVGPDTRTLRLISGLLSWCDDARQDVVEIKSVL